MVDSTRVVMMPLSQRRRVLNKTLHQTATEGGLLCTSIDLVAFTTSMDVLLWLLTSRIQLGHQ